MRVLSLESQLMKWSHLYSGCVFLSQSPNRDTLQIYQRLVFEVILDAVKLKTILIITHTLFKRIQNALAIMDNSIEVIQKY